LAGLGPVSVISLMTAAAVSKIAAPGSEAYLTAAITLALLSGLILAAMSLLRLGFMAKVGASMAQALRPTARGARIRSFEPEMVPLAGLEPARLLGNRF
jgi:hypothetical protein